MYTSQFLGNIGLLIGYCVLLCSEFRNTHNLAVEAFVADEYKEYALSPTFLE